MIAVESLSMRQGAFVLDGISFSVPAGAYAVLMGRTGCGKSSVIEAICGLRPIRSGRILVGGIDITRLPPGARSLGYVPQDGALFPTMDVRQHLTFALDIRGWIRARARERAAALADRLGIAHLLDRRIQGLSGGERQRVALGRAIAAHPAALILDEPLAAVDEDTRDDLCALLKDVCKEHGITALHITHSRGEADRLADLRLTMRDGRIA